jgi:ABC-type sugar transport system permease subunit
MRGSHEPSFGLLFRLVPQESIGQGLLTLNALTIASVLLVQTVVLLLLLLILGLSCAYPQTIPMTWQHLVWSLVFIPVALPPPGAAVVLGNIWKRWQLSRTKSAS